MLLGLAVTLPPALVLFSRLPGGGDVSPWLFFPDNLRFAAGTLNSVAPLLGAVLGASVVGSEYSLGTIGFLIALSGDRTRLFGAKALILGAYCFMTVCVVLAIWVGSATLCSIWLVDARQATVPLVEGVAATFALFLSLTFNGVLGMVGATLARSEYGGVLVGAATLMLGRFPISQWLPQSQIANVECRLSRMSVMPCPAASGASASLLWLTLYSAVIVAVGCVALKRQDLG